MCALAPSSESRLVGAQAEELSAAIRAAQLLLSRGATPFVVTAERWTPMHCLALHLDRDENGEARRLAEQLVLAGGSSRVVDAGAPMLLSDRRPNRACAPSVYKKQSDWLALTNAAGPRSNGAAGVAKALLIHGANLLSEDASGNTPAMTAAASNLLERRPDVREKLVQVLGHHAEDTI